MPGRLIYRCYRLPGQGYVTIASTERNDALRQIDDAILDKLRQGIVAPGCSGLVWPVSFEGRGATEILAFIHGAVLTDDAEKAIVAQLEQLKNRHLPETLDHISNENLPRSAAIDRMAQLLDTSVRDMSGSLPAELRRQHASAALPKNTRRKLIGNIALACVVLTAAVVGAFWWPGNNSNDGSKGPPRNEIAEIAELCYPGVTNREADIDRLVAIMATATWRVDDGPMRDYLRALPEPLYNRLRQPEFSPTDICQARKKMWALRGRMDDAEAALDRITATLGNDLGDQPALALRAALVAFLRNNPAPAEPDDCAAGMCLPLVSESDIDLKEWTDRLSAEILTLQGGDENSLADRLRSDEAKLRGELSLAGGEPKDATSNPFWSCGRETCKFSLSEATFWMQAAD